MNLFNYKSNVLHILGGKLFADVFNKVNEKRTFFITLLPIPFQLLQDEIRNLSTIK